jgi:hypothetical protein
MTIITISNKLPHKILLVARNIFCGERASVAAGAKENYQHVDTSRRWSSQQPAYDKTTNTQPAPITIFLEVGLFVLCWFKNRANLHTKWMYFPTAEFPFWTDMLSLRVTKGVVKIISS